MTHLDVILITVTLFISSTLGVYAGLKYINQSTTPPINVLTRSGDIELQYIEPSTNNTLDLLQPQQVYTTNINSCLEDSLNLERTQSYWSGNPPSYNTLDLLQPQQVYIPERIPSYLSTNPPSYQTTNINSWSENSLNLERIPSTYPSYHTTIINSCLENSINLNYIYLFFMVVLTTIIIIIINKKQK